MDYEHYDNDANPSNDDYVAFVAWLSEAAASELREAKGDPAGQKAALSRYYARGERAHLSAGELIDFLAVSTPSILDMAGYSDDESDAVMRISGSVSDQDLRDAVLPDRSE